MSRASRILELAQMMMSDGGSGVSRGSSGKMSGASMRPMKGSERSPGKESSPTGSGVKKSTMAMSQATEK